MNYDIQYLNIAKEIIASGVWKTNRTQYKSKVIPSANIVWDLRGGFPILTTKKVYYKQAIGEILGFLRGYDNVADFERLGCRWWVSDANENKTWLASPYRKGNNDLGKIYGVTWRKRDVYKEVGADNTKIKEYLESTGYLKYALTSNGLTEIWKKTMDQIADCCDLIMNNPDNRRNIFHAWFPELFSEMALPPCHVMYEFVTDPENKVLHMTMTQRSCDYLLGVPMNLLGSSLILAIIAKATGYTAGVFTHSMTDVHFYENQLSAIEEQLGNTPYNPPALQITDKTDSVSAIEYIEMLEQDDITICNYKHHNALIKVDMAQEK